MKRKLLWIVALACMWQFTACGQTANTAVPPGTTDAAIDVSRETDDASLDPNDTAIGSSDGTDDMDGSPNSTDAADGSDAAQEETQTATTESGTVVLSAMEPSDALKDISLLDAQAMGIIPAGYAGTFAEITAREANALLDALYVCFDAIGVEYKTAAYLDDAPTMRALSEWVYQIVAAIELPPDAATENATTRVADVFLREKGILYTDVTQDADARATVDDAMLLLARTAAYAAYANGVGSKGLLWEVSNEDATVYLLGSLHVDDTMIYPFDPQLTDIIREADAVVLELDFGDADGIVYMQNNSTYGDGDGLSNHISPALMDELMAVYAPYGVTDPAMLEPFRPWALASEILSLSLYAEDGQITTMPIVIDMYVYYKAQEAGTAVWQAESYQIQTDLFNTMDDAVLEEYLQSCVDMYNGLEPDEESAFDVINDLLKAWRARDPESFAAIYDKDAQEDALSRYLFAERDERLYQYTLRLMQEEQGTFLVTFGAGHMIGATGIVERLREEGFNARLMPVNATSGRSGG